MIKSLKFDEYHNITDIEFVDGVTANQALEIMYQLGIRRRPAEVDTLVKADHERMKAIIADSLHESD